MKKIISKFDDFIINEQYVIGSEPLENSMKYRKKLFKIIGLMTEYEKIIIDELELTSDDYSDEVKLISSKIRTLNNDIKLEDIEITLDDFIHKHKNK